MGPERVHMECASAQDGTRRFLLRRPKALQYFHGGELRKASEGERQAGRFELFLDLLCELSHIPFIFELALSFTCCAIKDLRRFRILMQLKSSDLTNIC